MQATLWCHNHFSFVLNSGNIRQEGGHLTNIWKSCDKKSILGGRKPTCYGFLRVFSWWNIQKEQTQAFDVGTTPVFQIFVKYVYSINVQQYHPIRFI